MISLDRNVLVLLPGLMCDETAWADQVAGLADLTHCHVPRYGTLNRIEKMAQHVLSTAPSQSFSLAGHSMGGRIALEIIRQAPERVTRLALLNTGYLPLAEGAAGVAEHAGRAALLAKARTEGMRSMGEQWVVPMVHSHRLGTPLIGTILEMIERSSPDQFSAQIEALLNRPDATKILPAIRCPTLLLCGRDDAWSPLARHQQMQSLIPGARLEVVEQCGHMAPMEQPRAVNLALRSWLEERP